MRVLIVDDSDIIRLTIEKYLSGKNIEIVGLAANGIQALELFEKHKPDVVTLDINMPQMDGITVMEKMLALRKEINIIIISAVSKKNIAIEALDKGAAGYIRKPFTEKDIIEALKDFM